MTPGVYIMQGGGFVVDGAATVAGVEVMVYNTTSTSYATGPISVTSLGKVALAAPLSGTYQGINFFQDRTLNTPIAMTGFGLAVITGVVYAAAAPVNLTGLAAVGVDVLGGDLRGEFHDGSGHRGHQHQPRVEPAAGARRSPGGVIRGF